MIVQFADVEKQVLNVANEIMRTDGLANMVVSLVIGQLL